MLLGPVLVELSRGSLLAGARIHWYVFIIICFLVLSVPVWSGTVKYRAICCHCFYSSLEALQVPMQLKSCAVNSYFGPHITARFF